MTGDFEASPQGFFFFFDIHEGGKGKVFFSFKREQFFFIY